MYKEFHQIPENQISNSDYLVIPLFDVSQWSSPWEMRSSWENTIPVLLVQFLGLLVFHRPLGVQVSVLLTGPGTPASPPAFRTTGMLSVSTLHTAGSSTHRTQSSKKFQLKIFYFRSYWRYQADMWRYCDVNQENSGHLEKTFQSTDLRIVHLKTIK